MSPVLDIVDQSNNNAVLTPLDGLQGYAHKMSEGHTFYDRYAAGRLRAAVSTGTRYVIPYHVIRAGSTSGTTQANYFLDCCSEAGFDVTAKGSIVMNDWEGWSDGFATKTQAMDFADRVNSMVGRECVIHYGGLPNPYDMGDNIWLADYRNSAPVLNRLFPKAAVWQWGNQAQGGGDTNQIIDTAWLDHLAGYDVPPPFIPDVIDPPSEVLAMPSLFKCSDQFHWLGSNTLPAGDYPAGYGTFMITESGAPRHVLGSEDTVYSQTPGYKVVMLTGGQFKELQDNFGVFKQTSSSAGCATEAQVKALLEALELTIDFKTP